MTAWTLFVDDERFPVNPDHVIARSSRQAIDLIMQRGMPIHICFDHDLAGDDTSMILVNWLIEAALDGVITFPQGFTFSVHSQNPVGVQNIRARMDAFLKHLGA